MALSRKTLLSLYLLLAATGVSLMPAAAIAWDATGHRLSAYVAWEFMSPDTRDRAMAVLIAHPRFQTDFLDAMPADIRASDNQQQNRWLFGQAAIWPDMARGLSGADRRRYDHPHWHWIDGAWLRDQAVRHGNLYVDTRPHADIRGLPAAQVRRRAQAENVVTALDLARYQLSSNQSAADQALALCWLLHLSGDIHQPLHTGALVSRRLFADGDRGGNAISVRLPGAEAANNLHAVWDGAMRGTALDTSLRLLLAIAHDVAAGTQAGDNDPTRWLQESRDLLISSVYPDVIVSDVLRSESTGNQPATILLDSAYEEQMQLIASQRIAEAGVRIANTLEDL